MCFSLTLLTMMLHFYGLFVDCHERSSPGAARPSHCCHPSCCKGWRCAGTVRASARAFGLPPTSRVKATEASRLLARHSLTSHSAPRHKVPAEQVAHQPLFLTSHPLGVKAAWEMHALLFPPLAQHRSNQISPWQVGPRCRNKSIKRQLAPERWIIIVFFLHSDRQRSIFMAL